MAKNLKLTSKNTQIAEVLNLGKLKSKLEKKTTSEEKTPAATKKSSVKDKAVEAHSAENQPKEEAPMKVRARSKSAFSDGGTGADIKPKAGSENEAAAEAVVPLQPVESELPRTKSSEELRKELFADDLKEIQNKKADTVTLKNEARPAPLKPQVEKKEDLKSFFKEDTVSEKKEAENEPIAEKIERPVLDNSIKDQPPAQKNFQEKSFGEKSFGERKYPNERTNEPVRSNTEAPRSYDKRPGTQGSSYNRFDNKKPNSPYPQRDPSREGYQKTNYSRDNQGYSGQRQGYSGQTRDNQGYSGQKEGYPRGNYPPRDNHSRDHHSRDSQPRENYPRDNQQREGYPRNNQGYSGQRDTPRDSSNYPPRERTKLGPTGKHVNDLLPKRPLPSNRPPREGSSAGAPRYPRPPQQTVLPSEETLAGRQRYNKSVEEKAAPTFKSKEFKDVKSTTKRTDNKSSFDARDRLGLRADDENVHWRKKKHKNVRAVAEDTTIRPTALKIRTPISIKDLAEKMKLKSSQLISKLFMQGLVVTLNDLLDDETTIQLLGHEFGCEISIDTSEEERIRITDKTVAEEIKATDENDLQMRAPIVAFMGHVDHGKTSLIDAIRSSNRAAGEAGAITQHIGAFKCHTKVGDICVLDTPGHEAFSAMRARGADVTDIVVLVVAGDEGMRQQTIEAMNHALEAKVTIVVAINKSDKPNFNPENVYRQLAENNLLPEAWGGQTITVNCSAKTGEGIDALLEMLALQAEVLELRANASARARGRVIESELHKGMGAVATVLVQNGTLKLGDCLVFDQHWGRIKTMQNDFNKNISEAGPSTPVSITGLSGLPEAGQEFIVVKNEKEAREISEVRAADVRQNIMLKKRLSLENLMQAASEPTKKVLNLIIRADVQGSLEALKVGLLKIHSKKAEVNIISAAVGEVSESDVQLASSSKATILGFHTQIENHAESLIRQLGVQVKMHDIIYHAIDDVKLVMVDLLDKIAIETDKGKFTVKALFKSSHSGIIAGGVVADGAIQRNHQIRVKRDNEIIATSSISSLKRVKDDVREVQKGLECGIVLSSFTTPVEGDVYEAYEITYITQEL